MANLPVQAAAPRPRGRQTDFTQALADEICARLSKGEPLVWICEDEHMPTTKTVNQWTRVFPEFGLDFGHARDDGYDYIAADAMAIANSPLLAMETVETDVVNKLGEVVTLTRRERRDALGHRRLQVETRLKLLARWDPRRYGEGDWRSKQLPSDASGDDANTTRIIIEGGLPDPEPPNPAADADT